MENRYKLPAGAQKEYLQQLEKVSGLPISDLAKTIGIVPRSYRDWRREKYPITQKAVGIIEKSYFLKFPHSKERCCNAWRKSKIEAARKGGRELAKRYGGPGTPEGRSRGGKHAMALLRAKGLVPKVKPFNRPESYSMELAEFVGILLGDGHVGQGQWTVTLNSVADKEYAKFVAKLVEKLFHFEPSVYTRKDSKVVIISGSGIRSIEYFQSIGLKIGDKVKQQVAVPRWIEENQNFRKLCLRGLVDTDGGIFIHRYKIKGKEYRYQKLSFVNRSIPLLNFAYETLKSLGFNPKKVMAVENKRVWLYNQQEVKGYLEKIGTDNPRLLKNTFGGLPER